MLIYSSIYLYLEICIQSIWTQMHLHTSMILNKMKHIMPKLSKINLFNNPICEWQQDNIEIFQHNNIDIRYDGNDCSID